MSSTRKFSASNEFIAWAQSLSGMLTKIKTEYGGITQMVENPAWDEGKTSYVLTLLKSLHGHIAELDTELSIHVKEKFSQEPR